MDVVRKPTIIFAGTIALISFALVYSAPLNELWKGIVSLPGVGALAAGLFQVFRDDIAHQRKQELQSEQQLFNLGATSHMANTVFDKHVEFCEIYLSEIEAMLDTCFRRGPHEDVLKHTSELINVRRKYTAWIPEDVDLKLDSYEMVARKMGASASTASLLAEIDPQGQRSAFVTDMYKNFGELLGIDIGSKKDEAEVKEAAVLRLKRVVREILQVNELISIREHLIKRAANSTTLQVAGQQ